MRNKPQCHQLNIYFGPSTDASHPLCKRHTTENPPCLLSSRLNGFITQSIFCPMQGAQILSLITKKTQDWTPDSQTQKYTTQLQVTDAFSGCLWLTLSPFFKRTASHRHDFITCFSSERSFLLLCAWRNKGKQTGKTCRYCNGSHQYRSLI